VLPAGHPAGDLRHLPRIRSGAAHGAEPARQRRHVAAVHDVPGLRHHDPLIRARPARAGRVRARRTVSVDIPGGVETGLRLQPPGSGGGPPAVRTATCTSRSRSRTTRCSAVRATTRDARGVDARRDPRSQDDDHLARRRRRPRGAPACSRATS
jgi:hypothetical protein